MRTSTGMSTVPPTRRKVCSWSTRSSLTCMPAGISPISSRKSVPPLAASKSPSLRRTAPENAPCSCPKSSLSRSSGDSAPQLMARKRRRARWLWACMVRAASSLPVPVSPCSSTATSVGARRMSACRRPPMAGDAPTISGTDPLASSWARICTTCCRRRRFSSARATSMRASSSEYGFAR